AKGNAAVTARSGDYRVWANTDRDGRITAWRGRAELILESKDFVAASKLASSLTQRMAISNIALSPPREAREAEAQPLTGETAKAFGFSGYTVKHLDLNGGGTVTQRPRAYAMAAPAMMSAKVADVPLEGGTSTVTVSVRGTVYLR